MPDLSALDGVALNSALQSGEEDPLAPVIVMTPIAGFPKTVDVEDSLGQPITLFARDRLTRFVATDNDHKLDNVSITFIDEEGFFSSPDNLAHGAIIDVAYGYKGNMSGERRLIIRRVQLEAMQGKAAAKRRKGFIVTIEGQAPGLVGLFDDGADVELFENARVSTIVRVLAARMGYHETGRGAKRLEINIAAEDDLIEKALTKPAAMKVPQFLKHIADRYGFIWRTGKSGMYFGMRDYTQAPSAIIDAQGSTLISYKLDGDMNLPTPKGLTLSGVEKGSFVEVVLQNTPSNTPPNGPGEYNPTAEDAEAAGQSQSSGLVEPPPNQSTNNFSAAASGNPNARARLQVIKRATTISQAIRKTNTVLRDYRPVTGSKAEIAWVRRFKQRLEKLWKLRVTVVGTPRLLANTVVTLKNFDTALLDGEWYVTEAKHSFDQGYTTELSMHRRRIKTKGKAKEVTVGVFTGATELKATNTKGGKNVEKVPLDRGQVRFIGNVPVDIPGQP